MTKKRKKKPPTDKYTFVPEICVCSHAYDEHDGFGKCDVNECSCFYFEADGG